MMNYEIRISIETTNSKFETRLLLHRHFNAEIAESAEKETAGE